MSGTKLGNLSFTFLVATSMHPNIEKGINQSVFNAKKHYNYFPTSPWSHKKSNLSFR